MEFSNDKFHLLPIDHPSITFRFLRTGDQSEIKSLCEQWFPLDYSSTWYDDIINDEKYFALAACHRQTKHIIGLLVALIVPLKMCPHYDQKILCRSFLAEGSACYILVLGVVNDYRRQGIGSLLLEYLYHNVDQYRQCYAIYLHVLQSNRSAIEFYRSQQFQCRQHLRRFYSIKNELFDALCFVRYVHNGYPPQILNDLLKIMQQNVLGRTFVQLLMRLKNILMHLCFFDR